MITNQDSKRPSRLRLFTWRDLPIVYPRCPIGHERDVVFLEDPVTARGYWREASAWSNWRTRRPAWLSGQLLAYAVLDTSTFRDRAGLFLRRVWWRAPHDQYPGGPIEAVDPTSIEVRCPSLRWMWRADSEAA